MDLAPVELETMVNVAVEDVRSHLPLVTRPVAEATVRRRLDWWTGRARVQRFVGIFAARDARAELAGVDASASAELERADAAGWVDANYSSKPSIFRNSASVIPPSPSLFP